MVIVYDGEQSVSRCAVRRVSFMTVTGRSDATMCHSAHRHVVIGPNKDINKAVGKGPIVMKTAVI